MTSFYNKEIGSLIAHLKRNVNMTRRMDDSLFEDKEAEIKKIEFSLKMLYELQEISNQNGSLLALEFSVIFLCISRETLKSVGFKLFLLQEFFVDDLQEKDWNSIKTSVYKDIRTKLPDKIDKLGYNLALETSKKKLSDLTSFLKYLESEYKKYWFSSSEMESKIAARSNSIETVTREIANLEKKISDNKNLVDAVTLLDEKMTSIDFESQRFDLIKVFFKLISNGLFCDYNEKYRIKLNSIVNTLREKMLKTLVKSVGYRLTKDLHHGDKGYPHISGALTQAFILSLNSHKRGLIKKYFIEIENDEEVEIDVSTVEKFYLFKNEMTKTLFHKVTDSIPPAVWENLVSSIESQSSNNEILVSRLLERSIQDMSIDFLNPERLSIQGNTISNIHDGFMVEDELSTYLNSLLMENDFVVSDKYLNDFIFNKKLKNIVWKKIKTVDKCISHYLDTGLSYSLIKKLFSKKSPETEVDAKKLLDEILENPGDDRLRIVVSQAIRNYKLLNKKNELARLFSDNNLNRISDSPALKSSIEKIKSNSATDISLSDQGLHDEDIKILSEHLKINSSVLTVDLNNNKISDRGIQFLTERLQNHSSIKYIDLGENFITENGASDLKKFLSGYPGIINLNLLGNHISKKNRK